MELLNTRAQQIMAYVRIAGARGRHVVAMCRQSSALFYSVPRKQWTSTEAGCFGPRSNVCSTNNQQQQRTYSSTVRSAGASWLRRKLYTLLAVVGISGGALILVSSRRAGHQLES